MIFEYWNRSVQNLRQNISKEFARINQKRFLIRSVEADFHVILKATIKSHFLDIWLDT